MQSTKKKIKVPDVVDVINVIASLSNGYPLQAKYEDVLVRLHDLYGVNFVAAEEFINDTLTYRAIKHTHNMLVVVGTPAWLL